MNLNALIPLGLLLLGAMAKRSEASQPTAARPRSPAPAPSKSTPTKNPPKQSMAKAPVTDFAQQAAVDAAVHHAVKHDGAPPPSSVSSPVRDAGVMDAASAMPQTHAAAPASSAPEVEVTDANAPHVVAALALGEYLKKNPTNFGSKTKPDAMVKKLQTAMGDISADGIVGPMTRARAQSLGVTLPAAPKKKK